MKKETILKVVINSFNIYQEEFENNNILYVYENDSGEIRGFETAFKKGNYKHLTGLDSTNSAENFYKKLERKQLSITDFAVDKDGTAIQKLEVIENISDILYKPFVIGYARHNLLKNNSSKVDIITGNSKKLTIGFKDGENSYPVTLMQLNPKDATTKNHTILFTLRKKITDEKYSEVLYWKEKTSKAKLRKIEKQYQIKIDYSSIKKDEEI